MRPRHFPRTGRPRKGNVFNFCDILRHYLTFSSVSRVGAVRDLVFGWRWRHPRRACARRALGHQKFIFCGHFRTFPVSASADETWRPRKGNVFNFCDILRHYLTFPSVSRVGAGRGLVFGWRWTHPRRAGARRAVGNQNLVFAAIYGYLRSVPALMCWLGVWGNLISTRVRAPIATDGTEQARFS